MILHYHTLPDEKVTAARQEVQHELASLGASLIVPCTVV